MPKTNRKPKRPPVRVQPVVRTKAVKTGCLLIVEERFRQRTVEGWTAEHDDTHDNGEMAIEAANLAADGTDATVCPEFIDGWGLARKHRGNRIRQLVIAGALIAAEIDRLQRVASGPNTEVRHDE